MKDFTSDFLVASGKPFRLADHDPACTPGVKNKTDGLDILARNVARLASLQYLLYAERKRALLIVLQAMDAGGKDGVIRRVMTGLNPQGCRVTAFKAPAGVETEHDYLWRIHKEVPSFGEIGIFNRSHYEDVLVVRVHEMVSKEVWSKRYDHINAFERMLADSGTVVLKFFLHIGPDEQRKRLEKRLQDPQKLWKISPSDFEDRKRWDDYIAAYDDAIERCSTEWAPWYVIPAEKKWFRDVAVSAIVANALERMELQAPEPVMDVSAVHFE